MPDITIEDRVDQLVTSPAGCALLLNVEDHRLSTADLRRPEIALFLAHYAATVMTPWDADHDWIISTALSHGPRLRDLAFEMVTHEDMAWWWEPLRRDAQLWTAQPNMEPFPSSDHFPTPTHPPDKGERYAQHPERYVYTSTERDGLSSLIAALAWPMNDWEVKLPAARKRVGVQFDARIVEIGSAHDWHELVRRYPADGAHATHPDFPYTSWGVSNGMVPDWSAIARDWDGVHISLWASVVAEQIRVESDIGWTELWGATGEHTLWLNWAFSNMTDLPNLDMQPDTSLNPHPSTLSRRSPSETWSGHIIGS